MISASFRTKNSAQIQLSEEEFIQSEGTLYVAYINTEKDAYLPVRAFRKMSLFSKIPETNKVKSKLHVT